MNNDYRNTQYCPPLKNLADKKSKVEQTIKNHYPKAMDMHAYISKNNELYKNEFMKVYNFKCAYCGAAITILSKEMFEIDHFIYEKSKRFKSKAAAGYMGNLVLACHSCNHKKSSFEIADQDFKCLYPDGNEITDTFYRDDMFYIKITDAYKENITINNFYEQLNLGGEVHRIDYLLMSMLGLKDKVEGQNDAYAKLGQAIEKLRIKRNIMS